MAKKQKTTKRYRKVEKEPVIKSRNFPSVFEVQDYGFVLRTWKNKNEGETFLCFEISGVDIWTKDVSEQQIAMGEFTNLIQTIYLSSFHAHILVSNSFSELNEVLQNSRKITQKNINRFNPKFAYAAIQTTKEIKEIQQTDENLKLFAQFSADKKSYHLIVGIGDVTSKINIQEGIDRVSNAIYGFSNRVGCNVNLLGTLPDLDQVLQGENPYQTFKNLQKKLFENPEELDAIEKKFLNGCLNSYARLDRVVGTMLTGYDIRSNSLIEMIERDRGFEMKLNVSVSDFNPSNELSHVDKIIKERVLETLKQKNELSDYEKELLDQETNPDRFTRAFTTKKLISIYRSTIKIREFSKGTTLSWLSDLSDLSNQYVHALNVKMSGFKVNDQQFIKKVEASIIEAIERSEKLQQRGKLVDAVKEGEIASDWQSIITGSDIAKRDIINTTVSISFNYTRKEAFKEHQKKLATFLNDTKIPNEDEHIPTLNSKKMRNVSEVMGYFKKYPILKQIRENKWNQLRAFENNGLPYLVFKRNDYKPTKTFLRESIYLPETTFASAYPFLSGSFIQPTGLPIGNILGTNEPIVIDPTRKHKGSPNQNIVVFGTSGSGKSTLAKKLTKIITLLDAQVIIFDPDSENLKLANNLQGDIITLGKEMDGGSYKTINPFQTMIAKTKKVLKNVPISMLNLLDYKFFENPSSVIRRLREQGKDERIISRLRKISKVFDARKTFLMNFLEIILYDRENYRRVATYKNIIETAISYIFSFEIIDRKNWKQEKNTERLYQGNIRDILTLIRGEDLHFKHSISGIDEEREKPTTKPKFPNNTQKELKDTCDFLSDPAKNEFWNKPTTVEMNSNLTILALKGIFTAEITKRERNAWMYLLLTFIDDHVESKENRLSTEVKARMKTQAYLDKRKLLRDRFIKTLDQTNKTQKQKIEELNIFENESDYNECKPVNVIVDEAHLMIDEENPVALRFFSQFTKRIRKRNGFVTFITQNVADFVPEGNSTIKKYSTAIINNTQYFFVFNLKGNDLNAFVTLFENGKLSEQELWAITYAKPGQGLFIHGNREKTMIEVNIENDYNVIGVEIKSSDGRDVRKAKKVEDLEDYLELSKELLEVKNIGNDTGVKFNIDVEDID